MTISVTDKFIKMKLKFMLILFKFLSFIYHVSVKSGIWNPTFCKMITCTSKLWYQILISMKEFSECFNEFVVKPWLKIFSVILRLRSLKSETSLQTRAKRTRWETYSPHWEPKESPLQEEKINNWEWEIVPLVVNFGGDFTLRNRYI